MLRDLTKLFRKHIDIMLKKDKVEILEKKPRNSKVNPYALLVPKEFIEQHGEETIIKILANTLRCIIFSDYQAQMRAGFCPHYAIYFESKPSISSDIVDGKLFYRAMFNFANCVKSRKKLKKAQSIAA